MNIAWARFVMLSLLLMCPLRAFGQQGFGSGFFSDWARRVDRVQSEQPHWVSPIATSSARLGEEVRFDVAWLGANGDSQSNYGNGKGVQFIPFDPVEVLISPPPYITHSNPAVPDGFADFSFRVKYRLLSRNEQHGNFILTAYFSTSIPTGSHSNGARAAVLTPTIAYGKGVRAIVIQGTLGLGLPASHTDTIGRTLTWNNALQYRIRRIFWPEVEANSTFFHCGREAGLKQTFITPGLVIGRIHIAKTVRLTIGGGFQIAATHFHSSNHNGLFSIRFHF